MKTPAHIAFSGFYAGSVGAAVLLAYGIESLVLAVRDPLANLAADAINHVIQAARFEVLLLHHDDPGLLMTGYMAVSGVAAVGAGFWLGAWVSRSEKRRLSNGSG